MGDVCTDGRFDLIERFKRDLVEATNIETSPEEMAVLDSILFRMWQMGWLDKLAASQWRRVEDNPPKPGCYLTASPFFHGDDYSWLYRLAWWTEHGLMDFVQDAEKESGWYIWNNSQDRDTEIEPMYWMPIEPPKEESK